MSEYGNSGDPAPPPSTPETRARSLTLRPSFLLALRGIWLFTWRPQLTWQRFPLGVLMLLALPVLVYLTTPSTQRWGRRYGSLGDPVGQVGAFPARRAAPAASPKLNRGKPASNGRRRKSKPLTRAFRLARKRSWTNPNSSA